MDTRLRRTAARLGLATLLMSALLLVLVPVVMPHMAGRVLERAIWLGLLMAAGGAAYFVAAWGLGAFRPADLRRQLLRRR